jgi:hypothetical protein
MASGASGRAAVLGRIQQSPLKPTSLLADLGSQYSYTEIQDALSDLLEDGEVILTPALILKLAGPEDITEES